LQQQNTKTFTLPTHVGVGHNEQFLPTGDTFRAILASERHWLQLVLVLFVHRRPTPTGVGRVFDYKIEATTKSHNICLSKMS
jgi:hypothetical protein